jgi:hypothetical protein
MTLESAVMNILNIHPNEEQAYSETAFLTLIESHLTYLRKLPKNQVVSVSDKQAYKYEGDLYGLLNDLSVPKKYHYIVMRVNDYLSSADYKGDVRDLLIPDLDEVTLLKNIYQTSSESA